MGEAEAEKQQDNRRAIVVGGGLVGCMTALFFAHQPHLRRLFPDGVDLYERRSDSRKDAIERGRSINLAVSDRTFRTLEQLCGDELGKRLVREVHDNGIRMHGRYIHMVERGQTRCKFMPYGRPEQYILSIDRKWLNEWLLTAAEKSGVRSHFKQRCVRVKVDSKRDRSTVTFVDEMAEPNGTDVMSPQRVSVEGRLVLGCDGLNSVVRQQMQRNPNVRMDFSQHFISHGYKELTIPPTAEGKFAMRNDSLHIWPRKQFMVIALPNPSKDFTVTFFAPYKGPNSFDELNTDEKVIAFFQREFPDALEFMGSDTLLHCWHTNPISPLSHVKCSPFHHDDLAVLLGDAAHAVVPFYGQGVNCGFEDVRYLDSILAKFMSDIDMDDAATVSKTLKAALQEYDTMRKPSADAICDLSLYNFQEMQASTASMLFRINKQIGIMLHKLMPRTFLPLYTMVSFSPDIPYHEALSINERRERFVERAVKGVTGVAAASLAFIAYRFAWPKLGQFVEESSIMQKLLTKSGLTNK